MKPFLLFILSTTKIFSSGTKYSLEEFKITRKFIEHQNNFMSKTKS